MHAERTVQTLSSADHADRHRVMIARVNAVTKREADEARSWLSDCEWADVDADVIAELPVVTIYLAVQRHYDGGWQQFLRDAHLVKPDRMDLTVYRVVADDGDDPLTVIETQLVVGRAAADHLASDLICRSAVMTVTCEPLAWGSQDELNAIGDAYWDGTDVHTPVAELGTLVGADFDPDNFDPVALLDHLRATYYPRRQQQHEVPRHHRLGV